MSELSAKRRILHLDVKKELFYPQPTGGFRFTAPFCIIFLLISQL